MKFVQPHRIFQILLAAACLAACSCQSGSLFSSRTSIADCSGEWIGPENEKLVVSPLPGERWEAAAYVGGQPVGIAGKLIEIKGVTFTQTELYRIEGTASSITPVYGFSKVELLDGRLILSRVKTSWLKSVAEREPGVIFSENSKVPTRTGGVSIDSNATRDRLLERALADPAAFEPPARYLRLK